MVFYLKIQGYIFVDLKAIQPLQYVTFFI